MLSSTFKPTNLAQVITQQAQSFSSTTAPKILLFFGAPGVGKGTYSKLFAKDFQFNIISMGDEIRNIIKNGSKLDSGLDMSIIHEIENTVKNGKLIQDDLVFKLFEEKMRLSSKYSGVILDGFPRKISQLEMLLSKYTINHVVNIELKEEILIQKILGRRVCSGCPSQYNVANVFEGEYNMPAMLPKVENKCDNCGGVLLQRDDDKEETIKQRMLEYQCETHPILEECKKLKIVSTHELKNGVADYPIFKQSLKDILSM